MVLTDGHLFVWDFIAGKSGRAQLVYVYVFCFLQIFVFLICQWPMVVVWTLTQNTDHDFKEWTKSLLRNSFVLTWGMYVSIDFLLYIGFNCSVEFVYWGLIILLTVVDFGRTAQTLFSFKVIHIFLSSS